MKNGISILIVDDEEMLRELLVKILKQEGYEVDAACDGESAREMLRQKKYDLMIADVKMPRMNGFELLKTAKSEFPELGVIMMTGYGDSYTVKDALLLGADEYITKPFKSFEVTLVVERAHWRLGSGKTV